MVTAGKRNQGRIMTIARSSWKKVSAFVMPEAGHLNHCLFGTHDLIKSYDQLVNSHDALPTNGYSRPTEKLCMKEIEERSSK